MGELDAIPAPPRRVRRAAAFRYRWILGVLSIAFLGVSVAAFVGLGALGVDLLPLRDDVLDAESARTAGVVTSVRGAGIHEPRGQVLRIGYRFSPDDGTEVGGASFAPPDARYAVGDPCVVEFLPDAAEVSRVRGTRRNPIAGFWNAFVGVFFLPSVGMLLVWVRGAMRTRLLLSTGRLTLARILVQRPVFGVSPPQRRVDYEFTDTRGNLATGAHWVGLHTPLGARLEREFETVPVIHDPGRPSHSRLAHRSDFLP